MPTPWLVEEESTDASDDVTNAVPSLQNTGRMDSVPKSLAPTITQTSYTLYLKSSDDMKLILLTLIERRLRILLESQVFMNPQNNPKGSVRTCRMMNQRRSVQPF